MGVQLESVLTELSVDDGLKPEVSVDDGLKPEEIKKLKEQNQDLMWRVSVMRARSKKDVEVKRMLRKKNEKLLDKIFMYESYKKRYQLQDKALAALREEAKELRQKDECQKNLLKEMDEALAFRLKEVDGLNLEAQMMANHIKQLEGGLVVSTFVEMEEAEEPCGSHRRTQSLPPGPERFHDGEEAAETNLDKVKAMIQYPLEQPRREDHEGYTQWTDAQIKRTNDGAIKVNRLVRDLRQGSAEAVRLRALGIAGD